jgi:cysteinylglycine-S-conjugate dipeptidase
MIRPKMRDAVDGLMPRLKEDLARLVAIPSVSAPGYPESTHGPLLEAYGLVAELFRAAPW